MPMYRVLDGRELASEGRVYTAGETLELPVEVAQEVRHLVQRVDALGKPVDETQQQRITDEIERSRPHERVSVLERELAAARQRVTELEAALAAAKDAAAPDRKTMGPPRRGPLTPSTTEAGPKG